MAQPVKPTEEVENSALGKFKAGRILGEKWKIMHKLDEGGFGSVYKVQNVKDPKILAALKVEPANSDEWNHLKLETAVLKQLHGNGMRAHVPQLFRSAKRRTYCYMIITLLGENLLKLKFRLFPKGMPLRSWTRVGVQTLYGIKTMHDRGYVHRDIKPQNFVLGYGATPAYARVVYIIDFGLSRNYAFAPTANCRQWITRRARARLEFRGTYRYAAPTMHEEKEQGRKDDIWSWLYMMMDLYCGLPWVDKDDNKTLEVKKLHMKDADLMTRMPEETKFIPKHLRSLNVYERPDYLKIYRALEALRKQTKTSYEDAYEWESKEAAVANKKAMRDKQAPIGYASAELFFKSDPIGIKAAPSAKDEQVITDRYMVKKKAKPEMFVLEDLIAISVKPPPKQPSPEKKTVDTPPTTPKSPGGVVPKKKTPRPASPAQSTSKQSTKKKKKAATKKRASGSMEESDDFMPSCYMDLDVPLHYLQTPNEDAKEFQKKVVGMDWGHVEPPKTVFKEAYSPQPAATGPAAAVTLSTSVLQPVAAGGVVAAPSQQVQQAAPPDQLPSLVLPPQQDSSGPKSDSQGPDSQKSVGRKSKEPEQKSPAISPTFQSACVLHNAPSPANDSADGSKKPAMQSSSSNNSVSLTQPSAFLLLPQPKKN